MEIKSISLVKGMSGKLSKKENLVFSTRFNKIFAWYMTPSNNPPSEAQLAINAKFASVNQLVAADMADPVKNNSWKVKMKESNGKYLTARGCAFAHYWAAE